MFRSWKIILCFRCLQKGIHKHCGGNSVNRNLWSCSSPSCLNGNWVFIWVKVIYALFIIRYIFRKFAYTFNCTSGTWKFIQNNDPKVHNTSLLITPAPIRECIRTFILNLIIFYSPPLPANNGEDKENFLLGLNPSSKLSNSKFRRRRGSAKVLNSSVAQHSLTSLSSVLCSHQGSIF